MITEQLIRSGQAFAEGVTSSAELLQMISDSRDEKAKNFWQHVIIVEVDPNEDNVEVQPVQSWGSWHTPESGKKPVFYPDDRADLAPVFLPSGGNPLHAQGYYGLPIYPVWEKHWRSFAESPDDLQKFLKPRLEKTAGVELSQSIRDQIYVKVHETVRGYEPETKPLGVMILVIAQEESAFDFSLSGNREAWIGSSQLKPEKYLRANSKVMLEQVWKAKAREGAEKGELENGTCAFTGERGPVVSGDNKSWPWFTTTWEAPFPEIFGKRDHVRQLALSPEAYKNLTVGANLFGKLTKQLDFDLNKQLFAPVDSARVREVTSRGRTKSTIYGGVMVTPLLDSTNLDEVDRQLFAQGMQERLKGNRRGARLLLENLLGYDDMLPEELAQDQFRLTSLYFSGDVSRADIHLHATIEDIVPSVLERVNEVRDASFVWSGRFYSEKQSWLHERTRSLPYLLIMAYGPAHLWHVLSTILHAGALLWEPFTRGVAHRCNELSHNLSDNSLSLRNEAVLYATFRHFYGLYHQEFQLEGREMRAWEDLAFNIAEAPVKEIEFKDVEELGFSAGYLVRRFASQYYAATDQKDYLQHRVMTFGSGLAPETIHKRALGKLPEYAMRVGANLSEDFRQRLGTWLSAYPRMRSEVSKQSDEFMAAFWAGYMLGRAK